MNIINENTPEIVSWAFYAAVIVISFFIIFVLTILSILIACKVIKGIRNFLN